MSSLGPAELASPTRGVLHGRTVAFVRTHWRALAVGGIALLVAASVTRFDRPGYVVVHFYTDQFRHEYAAWAFLHIGPRVFDTPIAQWHVHAAHPHADLWPTQPEWYPPGLLVLFMPFGVISNEGLLSDTRVAMLIVMMLGAAAVVAAFAFARALRVHYEPALALFLGALGAVMFVDWALNGFVDPLAAGLAIAGIAWAERGSPGRGLLALCAGLSIHFRLWYLWPVAIAIAVRHRREIRLWQFAAVALLAAASVWAFVLAFPSRGKLVSVGLADRNSLALQNGVNGERALAIAGAALLLLIVALSERRMTPLACLGLALGLVFGINEWEPWYPVLLMPLFLVVRTRLAQAALAFGLLQLLVILPGMPNAIRWLHLYYHAVVH